MKKFTIKDGEKNHQESTTPIYPNLTFTQKIFPEGENKRKDLLLIIIVTSLFVHLSCHTYIVTINLNS
jgi:hypothetical protein